MSGWGSNGPNTTHKSIIRTETAVCAHEWGSGTRQHDSRHVMLAARTDGAGPNRIPPSTQPFTIDPLPKPNASTTRSPPPSSQRPSLTRWKSWTSTAFDCRTSSARPETATTGRARPYPFALGACRPRADALDQGQDWSKQ